MRPRLRRPDKGRGDRLKLTREIATGMRWMWNNPTLRVLAMVLALMNVTFMAAFATWALVVRERLGLGPIGFGAILTVGAVGGLVGSAVVVQVTGRFGSTAVLRVGLIIETMTHLVLATTRDPLIAAVAMFVFSIHASTWGVTALTLRQRLIPESLLGRVNSAYAFSTRVALLSVQLSGACWLGALA